MEDQAPGTLLQRQARALGDPTRHAIFRMVGEAVDPIGVRELAAALDLHQSAIRQHLGKLIRAELVVESRQQQGGPGRPRSVFRRAPGLVGAWGTENPYERLSALLVDVVRSGRSPRHSGHDAGLGLAESGRVAAEGRTTLVVLTEVIEEQGFAPTVAEDGSALVLHHCPYAQLAMAAPEVVCQLHRGLAEGLTDALAGTGCTDPLEVTGLSDVDPVGGGCRIEVRPRGVS